MIMMEYLEFSFLPFRREIRVNSLDRLLCVLDKKNLVSYFADIGIKVQPT